MFQAMAMILVTGALTAGAAEVQTTGDLTDVSQNWSQAWEARKLDATVQLYADDAVFMDANGSSIVGKTNLRAFFARVLAQYTVHLSLHSVKTAKSGDLGYDWGTYTEVVAPNVHPDEMFQTSGAYIVILRRVSGHWLIANQAWTSSVAVPVKR